MDISLVDKFQHRLNGKSINIHAPFADKTGEFLYIFCRTVRIGTMQCLGAAVLADADFCRRMAYRAFFWNLNLSDGILDRNTLWNDFVRLNDFQSTFFSNSQTFYLAEVAKRCARNRGSFDLHRLKYCYRRNGRYRARPLDIIQLRLHRFILPFKSKARSRRMMSGHTAGCRIVRIIIADDQSVYRHIHLSAFYFLRPPLNRLRKSAGIRCFPVHNIKSLFFQKLHTRSPGTHLFIQMYQCKCMKLNMTVLYFFWIIQIQCSGCKVSWIGIFFVIILDHIINQGKIRIRDCSLSANDQMSLIFYLLRKSADCAFQKGDVSSNRTISTGQNLCKFSPVIGQHKCQAIQLPGKPDWTFSCPVL